MASPPGSLFYNPFFTPLAQRNTRGGLLFATPPSALLGEASKVVELMASRAAAGESAERGAGVSRAEVSQLQQCLESSMKGAEHLQVRCPMSPTHGMQLPRPHLLHPPRHGRPFCLTLLST